MNTTASTENRPSNERLLELAREIVPDASASFTRDGELELATRANGTKHVLVVDSSAMANESATRLALGYVSERFADFRAKYSH